MGSNPMDVWYVYVFILCLCCPVFRYRPCEELITRPRSSTACVKMIKIKNNLDTVRYKRNKLKRHSTKTNGRMELQDHILNIINRRGDWWVASRSHPFITKNQTRTYFMGAWLIP
jgi:hypothetical protein